MKRVICVILIVCSFAFCTNMIAFADGSDTSATQSTVITYDDGSYSVITMTESQTRSTKSGTKTQSHYSSSNVLEWKVTLSGTYTYNGSTSSCTNASCAVTIYDNSWYVSSKSSSRSGNKAIADVVLKKKALGVVVTTRNIHLELACDKNGTLS